MTSQELKNNLREIRIVPLFYEGNKSIACELMDACYAGGARVIEFTNRGEHALPVFEEMAKYASKNLPDLVLGIGSIALSESVKRFSNVGAKFIVSPFLDEDVAKTANRLNLPWIPGCATISEMQSGYKLGAAILKLFPGNIYGPGFIKAAIAPCPWLDIMPTGGVEPTEENLSGWFKSGAICVGMGSKLFTRKASGKFDFPEISKKVKYSIDIATKISSNV